MTVPAVLAALLALAAACGGTPPPATGVVPPAPAVVIPARGVVDVQMTFYGALDNDPPGSTEIAYPNGRHPAAGGTGTYADPLTAASDPRELPPGTLLYSAHLQAYLVMEDDCADCIAEWEHSRAAHIDIWTGMSGPGLLACEQALTPDAPVPVEVNPPPGRPTDPRPLYTPSGGCRVPS